MSLGLDENQKKDIREIKDSTMKNTIRKRADLEIARVDLRAMLQRDQVDMKAVEAKLKEMASLQTETRLAWIKAVQEIKEKLTPEQRKKFNELRKEHGNHRMEHDQGK